MKLGLNLVLNLRVRMESGKSLVRIQNWKGAIIIETDPFLLQVGTLVPDWLVGFSRAVET